MQSDISRKLNAAAAVARSGSPVLRNETAEGG
jgi:hypothetical protein